MRALPKNAMTQHLNSCAGDYDLPCNFHVSFPLHLSKQGNIVVYNSVLLHMVDMQLGASPKAAAIANL